MAGLQKVSHPALTWTRTFRGDAKKHAPRLNVIYAQRPACKSKIEIERSCLFQSKTRTGISKCEFQQENRVAEFSDCLIGSGGSEFVAMTAWKTKLLP